MKSLHFYILILFSLIITSCSHDSIEEPEYFPSAAEIWHGFDATRDYLIVVGDVQTYVAKKENQGYFRASMKWLANEIDSCAPVRGMLFTGDCTDSNSLKQWQTFQEIASIAAEKIPTLACSGNHDFDWARNKDHYNLINDRKSTHLTQYASFPTLISNLVAVYAEGEIDNVVMSVPLGGEDVYVMSLEFSPRPEVLSWASSEIAAHPEHKYIVMTHELLKSDQTLIKVNSYGERQFKDGDQGYSNPYDVWEALGYPHSNVIAFLCGHNGYSTYKWMQRADGGETPIVLFNLQYLDNGGNGELELWEFDPIVRMVNVRIFSTLTGEILSAPLSFPY